MSRPAVYLLDIEGTTTPVDFVTQTLFPYARAAIAAFLASGDPGLQDDMAALSQERAADTGDVPDWPEEPSPTGALGYIKWLMDQDRKSTGLKSLQGRIWKAGYEDGSLQGTVYPDVWPAVRRWKDRGARIAVFSSGSVLAQKLIFGHLPEGDMTPWIDAYFDTASGPKRSAESYRTIASALRVVPGDVCFLSDVQEEVDAALAAGMRATRVDREGRRPGEAITDFEGLD